MAFTIANYGRIRPYLYHLTAEQNLPRIRRMLRLECAASLIGASGNDDLLTKKRRSVVEINIAGEVVHIRDQAPLHEGNVLFGNGWSFTQLISDLNRRVFFWPGTDAGPISYGVRHFERYREDGPVLLRIPFQRLLDCNPDVSPEFCKFNSGSPRCTGGHGSARSSETFLPASETSYAGSQVVEVTFVSGVNLPESVCFSSSPGGPWQDVT